MALQQRVETLEQSQLQNPTSVELLVNSTKRYLAKQEYRIQLDELFSQETERLLKQLDDNTFSANLQWNPEQFRARVPFYESLTEPLAQMAGVLGRWGDDKDFDIVLDVLRNLFHNSGGVGSGFKNWLDLRSYPAVLVFTAYGIGLTKSERWETLLKLFSSVLTAENRESLPVVSTLFLGSWRGGEKELWQNLEGFKDRKTPLSDHLLVKMTVWSRSFVGVNANFELLFERFELMGSLAGFHNNNEEQLIIASESSSARYQGLAWMPIGRSGWHYDTAHKLLKELEDPVRIAQLLKVGFAKGSERFLNLFIQNFNILANRMRF